MVLLASKGQGQILTSGDLRLRDLKGQVVTAEDQYAFKSRRLDHLSAMRSSSSLHLVSVTSCKQALYKLQVTAYDLMLPENMIFNKDQ